MSSLQEQLLKAGLVDEKKLAQAERQKGKQAQQARKQHGKKGSPAKQSRPRPQDRKAERDRELNRQRQQEVRQKELTAQAKQLIIDNRLDRATGDQPFGFVYKRKVKKIYVTAEQRRDLAEGRIVIATWIASDGRKFELVPDAVAKKIAERDPALLVTIDAPDDAGKDENDPYAGYEVPDDLVW